MPASLSAEDRKLLRSSLNNIAEEYNNVPYYEGRMGASAREMKSILFEAAQNPEFPCLSPLAVLRELDSFVKRVTEYEFLKQDVKDGYHDAHEFITTTRNEYLNKIDSEVRDSIGLYDSNQWEEFLRKYVQQISHRASQGKGEEPDHGQTGRSRLRPHRRARTHRRSPTGQLRQRSIPTRGHLADRRLVARSPARNRGLCESFPEFWRKLEKHYFESQKALLTKMHNALAQYDPSDPDRGGNDEGLQLARLTIKNMIAKRGYCEHCAKEVITFLMRARY